MRHAILIAVLCISRIYSQVNPPDLRCLEVLNNNSVKLTWVPPTDPNNSFFSYEIYHSPIAAGPFTLVTNVLALSTSTFVDGSSNSGYYYLITRFNGGASNSKSSDTLRTIFLNIIPQIPDLKIIYNNIHSPKLTGSSSTFTINKEHPIGTWKNFAITSETKYADTLTVCGDSIKYQITLMDLNSGCKSVSNLVRGVYYDTKDPNTPYIDSISVLPNGNTILAWRIPRDMDIDKYMIHYLNPNLVKVEIDSVKGRSNTSYIYTTTTANFTTVGIYVLAVDSCKRSGTPKYDFTTMYLKAEYDQCAYQTVLRWNEYSLRPEEILEYRIYYSVNGGVFKPVGATTTTSFIHTNVEPAKNISYFVRMVAKGEKVTSSSNRAVFFSNQIDAAGYVYIKTATISDKNTAQVKLLLDVSKPSVGIEIYRSEDGISFTSVGFISSNGSPDYIFTDDKINSGSQSYFYKAVVKDSCGNARTISKVARTILLRVTEDKENMFVKYLAWNDYVGFEGGVSGYNIFRIVNDVVPNNPAGTTGPQSTSYTDDLEDEATQGSKIEYMVQAVEGVGNPWGISEISNSNKVAMYLEGRLFVPNAFAPGGVNSTWRPIPHFIDKNEYRVRVFNRWGDKVFETTNDYDEWNGSGCPGDMYAWLINYKNSRGEYKEEKGTVLLLR